MLVICEDCGKKYNIDESRITRNRARFTCNECGHIIIIDKADLSRSLFSSVNPNKGPTPGSSVDLVQEMQSSAGESSETESSGSAENNDVQFQQGEEATKKGKQKAKGKSEGMSLLTTFIILLLFTLISISAVTGYLFVDLFADPKVQPQQGFFLHALAYFGIAWVIVLFVFTLFWFSLQHKLKVLTNNANQLASGVYDVQVANKGIREFRYLASSLEKIRQRMKTMQ